MPASREASPSERPIRLLWLQTGAQIGGTEMMNFRTWQALDKRRFHVKICFLDEAGPVSELYRQAGTEPLHLAFHERPFPRVLLDLQRLLSRQPWDLLHIFGTRANLLGRLLAARLGQTKVISGQRSVGSGNRWAPWVEKAASPLADHYIANSYAGARWLRQKASVPAHKITTVHSGLEAQPYQAARPGQIRPSLAIASDVPVLVSIGNLRKVKDQETLLRAVRYLVDQGHVCRLILVGDGGQRAHLEEIARRLALTPLVHFLGRRTDVSAILADADIKVLSSRSEGLPAALMEAMAAALPVVATRVGGVPELVLDGETGLLVPPGNSLALGSALATLLCDPQRRRAYGRAGSERIRRHFSLQPQVTALEETYLKVLCDG